MALLERVSTLLRANINHLLEKAEDPEKLARQLALDMENQLLQVKTQVAIAIADQHMLEKKQAEQETQRAEWLRKAELAVARRQDDMARSALDRALNCQRIGQGLTEQQRDQAAEADALRQAYIRLQKKLEETQTQVDMLATQLRRNRAARATKAAHAVLESTASQRKMERLSAKAQDDSAHNFAGRALLQIASVETLDEQFATMEQGDRIDALLLELKARQPQLHE